MPNDLKNNSAVHIEFDESGKPLLKRMEGEVPPETFQHVMGLFNRKKEKDRPGNRNRMRRRKIFPGDVEEDFASSAHVVFPGEAEPAMDVMARNDSPENNEMEMEGGPPPAPEGQLSGIDIKKLDEFKQKIKQAAENRDYLSLERLKGEFKDFKDEVTKKLSPDIESPTEGGGVLEAAGVPVGGGNPEPKGELKENLGLEEGGPGGEGGGPGMPPEGMPPEGMPPEGMPPEGMPPEGMPPEGMPPEGMPPEGMPPEEGGLRAPDMSSEEGVEEESGEDEEVDEDEFRRILDDISDELKSQETGGIKNLPELKPESAKILLSNIMKLIDLRRDEMAKKGLEDWSRVSPIYSDVLSKTIAKQDYTPSVRNVRDIRGEISPAIANVASMHKPRGGPGSPPRPGHKYIRRWWNRDHWEYEYAHNPVQKPNSEVPHDTRHGVGKNAMESAVHAYDIYGRSEGRQNYTHSVEIPHDKEFEQTKRNLVAKHLREGQDYYLNEEKNDLNPVGMYRAIVQHLHDDPERRKDLTWLEHTPDNRYHLFRQKPNMTRELFYRPFSEDELKVFLHQNARHLLDKGKIKPEVFKDPSILGAENKVLFPKEEEDESMAELSALLGGEEGKEGPKNKYETRLYKLLHHARVFHGDRGDLADSFTAEVPYEYRLKPEPKFYRDRDGKAVLVEYYRPDRVWSEQYYNPKKYSKEEGKYVPNKSEKLGVRPVRKDYYLESLGHDPALQNVSPDEAPIPLGLDEEGKPSYRVAFSSRKQMVKARMYNQAMIRMMKEGRVVNGRKEAEPFSGTVPERLKIHKELFDKEVDVPWTIFQETSTPLLRALDLGRATYRLFEPAKERPEDPNDPERGGWDYWNDQPAVEMRPVAVYDAAGNDLLKGRTVKDALEVELLSSRRGQILVGTALKIMRDSDLGKMILENLDESYVRDKMMEVAGRSLTCYRNPETKHTYAAGFIPGYGRLSAYLKKSLFHPIYHDGQVLREIVRSQNPDASPQELKDEWVQLRRGLKKMNINEEMGGVDALSGGVEDVGYEMVEDREGQGLSAKDKLSDIYSASDRGTDARDYSSVGVVDPLSHMASPRSEVLGKVPFEPEITREELEEEFPELLDVQSAITQHILDRFPQEKEDIDFIDLAKIFAMIPTQGIPDENFNRLGKIEGIFNKYLENVRPDWDKGDREEYVATQFQRIYDQTDEELVKLSRRALAMSSDFGRSWSSVFVGMEFDLLKSIWDGDSSEDMMKSLWDVRSRRLVYGALEKFCKGNQRAWEILFPSIKLWLAEDKESVLKSLDDCFSLGKECFSGNKYLMDAFLGSAELEFSNRLLESNKSLLLD